MGKTFANLYPLTLRVNLPNCKNSSKLVRLQPLSLTSKGVLEMFPEAREIISEKLKEWQERERKSKEIIRYNLRLIRNRIKDDFSRWFWREVAKVDVADDLLEIEKQIQRLKRLEVVYDSKLSSPKILYEEKIERARLTSIVEVGSSFLELKKSGKNYIALCPFHQEKHPSFYLYTDTNSFYCFGCLKGGDVIKFVELAFNYSFKEAVEYLTRR